MSFDSYKYLILKKVDSHLSVLNISITLCNVLARYICSFSFLKYIIVMLFYGNSLCLMYYLCCKGTINEIGYKPVFLMKYCQQGLLFSASGCLTSLCCLYLKFCCAFKILC